MAEVRANEFDETLDGWVRAAFVRGVRTFPDLVRSLPGVYPADALRAVVRLREELPAAWQLSGTRSVAPLPDGRPVEHPLDFDWRFTPEAVRLLIDRCQTTAAGPVAFLGAPSLAREAAARGWPAAIALFDQNPVIVEAIRASLPGVVSTCLDLVWGEPVANGDADVAVADPPWYPEHTAAFLWAAARLTKLGGRVLLSLPAVGTRPGIPAERDALFSWAAHFGLRLAAVESGILAYRTPPFEKNALAAAGVPPVPWDWRRGDLAEFVVVEQTSADRPEPLGPPDLWDEESVGVVRIKCRACSELKFRDPTLSRAVPDDMLVTVSRREPARASADVWTCGNRIFRCAGTGVFRVIVSALERRDDPERTVAAALRRELSPDEVALVRRAAAQVFDLVRREERELTEDGYRRHERNLAKAI
jgi:hypothetical protein